MQHFFNEQTKTRIKTFVFNSAKNFHTRYKGFLIKYRQEVFLREIVKISTLGIITLIGFWFYLFFINIASTRGYFLKIAQDQLNSNRAKSDIIKLEVVKEKRKTEIISRFLLKKHLLNSPLSLPSSEQELLQGPQFKTRKSLGFA